ncbi:MAG TPA: MerR family transcriptional regulator [Chitinophaga sp.]|uniref:MerR family transcriptional regulator n=1 Tax=Chitinophaga sp. TaxID=1869181 RepID=UPI002CAE2920|nr:MerR family transcriptional regulator [Chitinophaga sp.]HVI44310.1 MerR family transcriptional regulator [Chitinophaga sp.]
MSELTIFTIKDIENLTGIKAHTIRIWEQRYRLFQPKRKATNRRIYDNEDVKKLLRIAGLYHHGIKISRIAALSEEEQKKLFIELTEQNNRHQLYINYLLEATLNYDQQRFETVFHHIARQLGFEQCITQVIYPFLEKAGVLWLTGDFVPAHEHFFSHIIRQKLLSAIDKLTVNTVSDEHFLLFLPEGEFHEIPLLYIHYLLKKHHRKVTNFGSNVSVSDLRPFIATQKVTHLYTHLVSGMPRKAVNTFAESLSSIEPQIPILLAGPQTEQISIALPHNIRILRKPEESGVLTANSY